MDEEKGGYVILMKTMIRMVRTSLIYNLCISLLLIFTILYFLFLIAPHTGTLSFTGNGEELVLGSKVDSISLKVYNPDTEFTNGEQILLSGDTYLSRYDVLYDGQNYTYNNSAPSFRLYGEFWIYLNREQDFSTKDEINSELQNAWEKGTIHSGYKKGIYLDAITMRGRRADRSQILDNPNGEEFIPDFFRREDNATSTITVTIATFDERTETAERSYSIDIAGSEIACNGPELRVRPAKSNCKLYINEEPIDVVKDIILRPSSESANSRGGFETDKFHYRGNTSSEYFLSLNGIKNVYAKGSGELEFNYGNAPVIHKLNRRVLRLFSKDRQLDMTMVSHQSENKLFISGDVSEALLSDLDLFPSFSSWYRNNVYLVPLTLITTIFAGVSLMQSSRKLRETTNNSSNNEKTIPTILIKVEAETPVNIFAECQEDSSVDNDKECLGDKK